MLPNSRFITYMSHCMSRMPNHGSEQVQCSEGGDGALRRPWWPSARPENDRKTAGFTKPLRPELNLGKEKVKDW
jgi:hypothetical protein